MNPHSPMDPIASALVSLAGLMEYPTADIVTAAEAATKALAPLPDARAILDRFNTVFLALREEEREELFTATFDVSPSCAPYLSIHLFGEENFKRGAFMAALNARYAETGFDPGDELPDHLRNLLRFAAQTVGDERRELVEFCILGPLNTMIFRLQAENPYRTLLEAVQAVLQTAFPGMSPAPGLRESAGETTCNTRHAGCGCASMTSHQEPLLTH